MSKKQKKHINQSSNGTANLQVGGDLTLNSGIIPANTERLVPCPECKSPISLHTEACRACGFPIADEIARLEFAKKARRARKIGIIAGCFVAALWIPAFLLPPEKGLYFMIASAPGLLVLYSIAKQFDNPLPPPRTNGFDTELKSF